jgi:phage repressor protein C with HTH and peptisase S24 domain
MGDGLLLRDQPGVIQSWGVSREWVEKNVRSHTGVQNLCIVTGFGDSMKGMFNSGDPLIIDRGVNSVEGDAVYFFRVENEGFIKRLQRVPGEGLRVLSENKKYETWTIKAGMDFEVFGRVIKAWQGEDF